MRSDAILFFSGKDNEAKNRMVRAHSSQKRESVQGFGEHSQKSDKETCRFSTLYERIAGENRTADQSVSDGKPGENRHERKFSAVVDANRAVKTEVKDISSENHNGNHKQAGEVIKDAILKLSSVLNLNIHDAFDDIAEEAICGAAAEQFAQILWALKHITSMLESAVAEGTEVEIKGVVFDPQDIPTLLTTVQQEKFRLELGLNALGTGKEVKEELALKLEGKGGINIPQAIDPSQLELSRSEVRRIFGKFHAEPTDKDLETAIAGIKALIGEPKEGADIKIEESCMLKPPLDSKTMRALLKIDSNESVAVANRESAMANESLELPEVIDLALAKNPDAEIDAEGNEQAGASLRIDASTMQSDQSAKLQSVLSRITDESLVNQVANRMQNAIRSGVHELRIQLRPETLGDIQMSIRMEGEVVSARILVENSQVKQIIENNLQMLKDALEEKHIDTGAFSVDVGGGDDGEAERLWQQASGELGSGVAFNNANDSGAAAQTQGQTRKGVDTGRRYGNNSMEFFA